MNPSPADAHRSPTSLRTRLGPSILLQQSGNGPTLTRDECHQNNTELHHGRQRKTLDHSENSQSGALIAPEAQSYWLGSTSMASAIQAASPPGPPPTFARMTTDTSMHSLPYVQPSMNSFDTSKSGVNTPTPTPPASRGNHHAMPYNNASFGPLNGYHSQQQNTPRGYGDINGNVSTPYPPGQQPQIYTV